MQDIARILKNIRGYIRKSVGTGPFKIVSAGNTLNERSYAIQAKDGDLTYSATTTSGDDIPSGSVLRQDASVVGDFNSVSVDGGSSGRAIVYLH